MHILSASRQRIELEHLPSSFLSSRRLPILHVAADHAPPLLTDAARAFFGMPLSRGARPAVAPAPAPPAVFREPRSGLFRMVHHEIMIRFVPGTSTATRQQILAKHGFVVRSVNRFVADQMVVVDGAGTKGGVDLLDIANDWAEMPEVAFATPNFVSQYRRGAAAAPTIQREQWYLRNTARHPGQRAAEDVAASAAWKITTGRPGIVVAIIDDGIDVEHPNLKPNIKRRPDPSEPRDMVGRDFFVPEGSPEHFDPRPKRFQFPYDELEGNDIHGTPCAGIVAAAGRNRGPVGIAPRCRLLAVKVYHGDDLTADARVADAIRYAALHADLLSCSWEGGESPDVEFALRDARAMGRGGRGAPVFCAAGNENHAPVVFPARHPDAIAIGASTDTGRLASYSNVGPEVWVVAPSDGGVRAIFTADVSYPNRGFNTGSAAAGGADGQHTLDFGGTSAATPLAAGVAALMLSANASLDVDAVKEILASTAEKIGSGYEENGHSERFGFGRVHAGRAVAEADRA